MLARLASPSYILNLTSHLPKSARRQRSVTLFLPASQFSLPSFRTYTEPTKRDWFIANKLRSLGMKQTYNYRWNTPDPVQLAAAPWKGVLHTSDLFFLFNGTKYVLNCLVMDR
jgi:hypothetical protein